MRFHIKRQTIEKLRDHKFANKFIYCVSYKTSPNSHLGKPNSRFGIFYEPCLAGFSAAWIIVKNFQVCAGLMKKFVVCVCDERYSKIEKQVIGVEMKKIVIYARYSSDRQTEQSIEGQLRVCHEYAERND